MLVLGIDPGTAVTGYGLVRSDAPGALQLVECGVIRTKSRHALAERLRAISDGLEEILSRHQPDALAVENVFYGRNVHTTLALGHARGVVLLAGERAGLIIHEYAPAVVKKSVVGNGMATKEQVQFMIMRLLRLRSAPSPSDAADGVAVAVTCLLSAPLARLTRRGQA